MTSIEDVVEAAEGDVERLARSLVNAFFAYIEDKRNVAYHQGMCDGLSLRLSAAQLERRKYVLSLSVDDLELSVRTGNILRKAGVTTMSQFLALKKADIVSLPHAGSRTWREIWEVQSNLAPERD